MQRTGEDGMLYFAGRCAPAADWPYVMCPLDAEPEPNPSEQLLLSWDEANLRRTVSRDEWVGCWRRSSGYVEFFIDGTARQKWTSKGTASDFRGTIEWEWVDERRIRVTHSPLPWPPAAPPQSFSTEQRVIRYDGKLMWTEVKFLDGPAAGVELTQHLVRASQPKTWLKVGSKPRKRKT